MGDGQGQADDRIDLRGSFIRLAEQYYLYFVNLPTSEFAGNPCWCVDLGIVQLAFTLPNYPITTLGFKPQDVHVSSTGECYALLDIDAAYDPSNRTKFIAAESDFNQTFSRP